MTNRSLFGTAIALTLCAAPAAASVATHFEDFNDFPENTYLETKLPGAYVTDGYATGALGCTTGCNRYLTSFNGYDAVQIDFDRPQDYVSFNSVNANGILAYAFSYVYGSQPVIWLDYIALNGPSAAVQTLRSPVPGVPNPYNDLDDAPTYYARIQTVVFTHVNGGGGWAIDNLSWSGAVPEPATWAMMLSGFGLAGGALRRARRQTLDAVPA